MNKKPGKQKHALWLQMLYVLFKRAPVKDLFNEVF